MPLKGHKIIIGRSESISFPELFLDNIPAKTDCGAFRSAIHATDIKITNHKNGKKTLSFFLLNGHASSPYSREAKTQEYKLVRVENSFGQEEDRYAVVLKVKVGPKICRTEFTLADRSMKTYPVLLGRKLTNDRYLIDSSISNVDRKKLKLLKVDLKEDLETKEP